MGKVVGYVGCDIQKCVRCPCSQDAQHPLGEVIRVHEEPGNSCASLVSCRGCTQQSGIELPWLSCALVSREEKEGNVLAKINQVISQ